MPPEVDTDTCSGEGKPWTENGNDMMRMLREPTNEPAKISSNGLALMRLEALPHSIF